MHVGGTEQYLLRTLPLIRDAGHDVDVYLLDRDGPLLRALLNTGIGVHGTHLPRTTIAARSLHALSAVRAVAALAIVRRYRIVHTYLYWSDVVGALGAALAGSSRIVESRRAMRRWRRPDGLVFKVLESVSNGVATDLIANSQAVLREAEAEEWFLPRRRTVIYNGVDVPVLHARQPALSSAPLRLLCVGALAERKGQDVLLEAFAIARRDVDVVLDLIGGGPCEATLKEYARSRGLTDFVAFHGERPDPDSFYRNADVFVLPSRQEGFSNALLEAMAYGLPVIATDVGGNREAIHPDGGLLVPAMNAAALADAILRVAERRRELAAMGDANRNRVEHEFTLRVSAERTVDWYESAD